MTAVIMKAQKNRPVLSTTRTRYHRRNPASQITLKVLQPTSVPNAGPKAMTATMLALAKPRLCSGKYRDKMVEHAGYETDSPAPSANRATSNVPNACTAPVAAVAADQRNRPMAITHFTSKRSTSQPETGRKNE